MKRYNHGMDLAFTVLSDTDEPTKEEIIFGLERRLRQLKSHDTEVFDATDVFDTCDNWEEFNKEYHSVK